MSKTLTAATVDIEDLDGPPTTPTFTYQWVRVDGLTDTDIPGATSETYTLTASDLGKQIKVKVTFTGSRGQCRGPAHERSVSPERDNYSGGVAGPLSRGQRLVRDDDSGRRKGDGRLLGYDYDKFGSLDDGQIATATKDSTSGRRTRIRKLSPCLLLLRLHTAGAARHGGHRWRAHVYNGHGVG